MEGFKGAETALILKIPEGTVASRLHAGGSALKRMLTSQSFKTAQSGEPADKPGGFSR